MVIFHSYVKLPEGNWLVVLSKTPLKKMRSSDWIILPAIGENKKFMVQTTNQLWYPVIHIQLPSGKLTQLWKITIFNGKTHYKWPCSIAI